MDCIFCRAAEDSETLNQEKLRSKKIDYQIKQESKNKRNLVKILLLGPGESGKSTVFKQLKIISSDEHSLPVDERMNYKPVIIANCISQMKVLVNFAARLKIPLQNQENFEFAKSFMNPQVSCNWSIELAQGIKNLWADSGIKQVYDKRDLEFQLNDSADYFFDNVDRFTDPNYVPTNNDVLRVRVRSTGIEETLFKFDDMNFRVVDVGGQRSERRKWIHCFSGVNTILFCASLIGYCQTLREQEQVSRMDEAIELFSEVTNSSYFQSSSIILFLNKDDLFVKKIQTHPLVKWFENYEGAEDVEKARAFVKARFLEVVSGADIYCHFTTAIDTKNIEHVIYDVRKNVLDKIIEEEFI